MKRKIYFSRYVIKIVFISFMISFVFTALNCSSTNDPSEDNKQGLFTDNFDGTSLNTKWYWSNEPDVWDLGQSKNGWLSITGNLNSNLWCSDETSRLYQIVEDDIDFDISTKLYCEWGNNNSDIAGFIVKFPSVDNWINIKFWMHQDGTGRLEFQKKCTDVISPVPGYLASGGSEELFLRLVKEGNEFTGYYKSLSDDEWKMIGSIEGFDSLPMQIGFFGSVDSGVGNLLIQFDFFQS